MSNTANLELPLVAAAQAQKHVTVNEALSLLDGLCQMTFESVSDAMPPASVIDGALYAVPGGAGGSWAGQDGQLAVGSNGGWRFLAPKTGWKGWVKDIGQSIVFDGTAWQQGGVIVSDTGASTLGEIIEMDVVLTPGAFVDTTTVIPSGTVVIGVTARVLADVTGTMTSWRLGVSGSTDRYGSGLGLSSGSYAMGLTGQPQAYYGDTALRLEAEGGDFSAGEIRVAIHLLRLVPPRS